MLEILVCPICKGKLEHDRSANELICHADKLAFPVRDGIPVMLIEQARDLHANTGAQASPSGLAAASVPASAPTSAPTDGNLSA